jgi:hypothetical protein
MVRIPHWSEIFQHDTVPSTIQRRTSPQLQQIRVAFATTTWVLVGAPRQAIEADLARPIMKRWQLDDTPLEAA